MVYYFLIVLHFAIISPQMESREEECEHIKCLCGEVVSVIPG